MLSNKVFRMALFLLILTAGLDLGAIWFHLYWTISWFDSVVHFVGGMCVGMSAIWLMAKPDSSKSKIFVQTFLVVLAVGIIWEIFELYFGITFFSDGIRYITDTGSDLLMDVTGGFVSAIYTNYVIPKM